MKQFIFLLSMLGLLFFLAPVTLFATAAPITIALEKAPINIHDTASIQRGAHFFATICMACHTLTYLRYDTLAAKAGVIYEKMPLNVQQWPFGIKPPDLSLEANYRGVDWIYTYLHSFYQDTTRPTGFNNLLLPNTAMPGILAPYQGLQTKTMDLIGSKRLFDSTMQWYDLLTLQQQGSMTPIQFDETLTDIVNFLNYAANPQTIQQRRLGPWVIGFFIVLFILMYCLKQDYWKNIK